MTDFKKIIDEYTEDYCKFLEATYSEGMMSEVLQLKQALQEAIVGYQAIEDAMHDDELLVRWIKCIKP